MLSNRVLLKSKQNIVVLDDDDESLQILKDILKPFFECNISFYNSPSKEFCQYVENNSIDLFIMDIRLNAYIDGIELSKEIIYKKQGSLFLFISGYEYSIDSFNHLAGKCVYDFLAKPLDVEQFVIIISTLLNIASSYKMTLTNGGLKPRETKIENMRSNYRKLIEEDKLLINRLKEVSILQS